MCSWHGGSNNIILSSCCLEYQLLKLKRSIILIIIINNYLHTKILDNRISIASKGLWICPQLPCSKMPTNSGAHPNFKLLLIFMLKLK